VRTVRHWNPEVGTIVVVITDRWAGENRVGVVRGLGEWGPPSILVEILRPDGNVGKKISYNSASIAPADAVTTLGLLSHPRFKPETIDGRGRWLAARGEYAYEKERLKASRRAARAR